MSTRCYTSCSHMERFPVEFPVPLSEEAKELLEEIEECYAHDYPWSFPIPDVIFRHDIAEVCRMKVADDYWTNNPRCLRWGILREIIDYWVVAHQQGDIVITFKEDFGSPTLTIAPQFFSAE